MLLIQNVTLNLHYYTVSAGTVLALQPTCQSEPWRIVMNIHTEVGLIVGS